MSIPIPANITCDIYRSGNAPPASPDVEAVAIHLTSHYEQRLESGEMLNPDVRYTHVALFELSVDVRDDWNTFTSNTNPDTIYVPDKDGGSYNVVFVERVDRNLPTDHKRAYLHRDQANWDDLY